MYYFLELKQGLRWLFETFPSYFYSQFQLLCWKFFICPNFYITYLFEALIYLKNKETKSV